MSRKQVTLERTYEATLAEVWELWTTKDGIEAWWGPEGFRTEVREMDVRAGGTLHYAFIAETPEIIAFLKEHGMPAVQELRATYTEVVPTTKLAWENLADFIPGVAPYPVTSRLELFEQDDKVRMVLVLDAMHAEEWTSRAVEGWTQELGKLERQLAKRRG